MIGYLFAVATALSWAALPVMAKLGLGANIGPVAGALVSTVGVLPIYWLMTVGLTRQWGFDVRTLDRRSLYYTLGAGFFASSGAMFYYGALTHATVATVIVTTTTTSLILNPILVWLLLRRQEKVTPLLLLGIVLVLTGTTTVLW